MKKLFSIDEANRVLPTIKSKIGHLIFLRKRIQELRHYITHLESCDDAITPRLLKEELYHYYETLHHEMEDLEFMGVLVKNIEQGLVDFYTEFEGRTVLLCWKHGEDKVKHWHEVHGGLHGRKPIIFIE